MQKQGKLDSIDDFIICAKRYGVWAAQGHMGHKRGKIDTNQNGRIKEPSKVHKVSNEIWGTPLTLTKFTVNYAMVPHHKLWEANCPSFFLGKSLLLILFLILSVVRGSYKFSVFNWAKYKTNLHTDGDDKSSIRRARPESSSPAVVVGGVLVLAWEQCQHSDQDEHHTAEHTNVISYVRPGLTGKQFIRSCCYLWLTCWL